jgi:hypothetical protein
MHNKPFSIFRLSAEKSAIAEGLFWIVLVFISKKYFSIGVMLETNKFYLTQM